MILNFPGVHRLARRAIRRARRRPSCPRSLHIYRRALLRRMALPAGDRPAYVLDSLARALISARVA